MKRRKSKPLTAVINAFLIFSLLLCSFFPSVYTYSAESESTSSGEYNINEYTGDLKVVVSLGDSYSSGEGVEPFYEQDQIDYKKEVFPEDWRAHRSENSWSSKLHLTFNDGWTMVNLKEAKVDPDGNFYVKSPSCAVAWFFEASSGATSEHWDSAQKKNVAYYWDLQRGCVASPLEYSMQFVQGTQYHVPHVTIKSIDEDLTKMPPQSEVFQKYSLKGKVDYVTLTMGGNDIGFSKLVEDALLTSMGIHLSGASTGPGAGVVSAASSYLCPSFMQAKLNDAWEKWESGKRESIKTMYYEIAEKAGKRAAILVAGYPKLLSSGLFSESICDIINKNAIAFNDEIKSLVRSCRREGLNIYFIDVEEAFDGHAAYAKDPHINPVMLGAETYDLDQTAVASSYSIHPNNKGTDDYAECVQKYLDRLDLPDGQSSSEVNKRPKIITQPQDFECGANGNFVFTVEANERDGDSRLNDNPCMFYWWEYSTDEGISWNNVPDEQNARSSLSASVSEDYKNGTLFRCRVIGRYGYSIWTETASLQIRDNEAETDPTETDSSEGLSDESDTATETPENFYEVISDYRPAFALLDMNEDGIAELATKRRNEERRAEFYDPLIAAERKASGWSIYSAYAELVSPSSGSEIYTTEIDETAVAYIQENYPRIGLTARKGVFYKYGNNQDEAKFCFYDKVFKLYNFNGYYYFSSYEDGDWNEEDIISGVEYRQLWSLLVDNGSVKPLEYYENTEENRAALLPYYPID